MPSAIASGDVSHAVPSSCLPSGSVTTIAGLLRPAIAAAFRSLMRSSTASRLAIHSGLADTAKSPPMRSAVPEIDAPPPAVARFPSVRECAKDEAAPPDAVSAAAACCCGGFSDASLVSAASSGDPRSTIHDMARRRKGSFLRRRRRGLPRCHTATVGIPTVGIPTVRPTRGLPSRVRHPRNLDQLSGVGTFRPALPPGVLKQQRHVASIHEPPPCPKTSPRVAAHTGMLTGAWREKSLKPLKPGVF